MHHFLFSLKRYFSDTPRLMNVKSHIVTGCQYFQIMQNMSYSSRHRNVSKTLLQRYFLRCVNVSGASFLESLSNVRSKTLKERYK